MKTKLKPTNRKENYIMKLKGSLIMLAIVSLLAGGLLTSLPTQASAGFNVGAFLAQNGEGSYGDPGILYFVLNGQSLVVRHNLFGRPLRDVLFSAQVGDKIWAGGAYDKLTKKYHLDGIWIYPFKWENGQYNFNYSGSPTHAWVVYRTYKNGQPIDSHQQTLKCIFAW